MLVLLIRRAGNAPCWVRLRGAKAITALHAVRRGDRVVCVGTWLRGRLNILIAKSVVLEAAR